MINNVRVCICVLLVLCGGCGNSSDVVAQPNLPSYSASDPWFRPCNGSALMQDKFAVPRELVVAIDEPSQKEASAILDSKPWRKLSREEALRLGVQSFPEKLGREPFLLRGLVLNERSGSYQVFERDGDILVHHVSMGRKPLPMRRRPLVAFLTREPKEVYVSVALVE